MAIAFTEDHLKIWREKLKPKDSECSEAQLESVPFIAQQYINHDATVHKVCIIFLFA